MKSVLFVCSANKDRSKTAEDYFSAHYPEISFESVGTNKKTCQQLGTNYITLAQLEMATIIYVMEQKHRDVISALFGTSYFNKIKILHIKDLYTYGSKKLIFLLESKINL